MPTEELTFTGSGGDTVAGLLALPGSTSEPAPGVLLIHAVGGLDATVRAAAERLAAAGFGVLAPNLWARSAASGDATAPRAALPDRQVLADLDAALVRLAQRPEVDGDRLAALGLGTGGTYAFLLGCRSDRVAAVIDVGGGLVYPELSAARPMQPLEMALNLSAPFLGLFGGADAATPPEHVERLRTTLDQFARRADVRVLAGAGPGFFDDAGPGHVPEAAAEAWRAALAFLRDELEFGAA